MSLFWCEISYEQPAYEQFSDWLLADKLMVFDVTKAVAGRLRMLKCNQGITSIQEYVSYASTFL